MRRWIVVRATFIGVLLWTVSTALTGWAQVDTATVVGTIRDSSGAVVPNVTITATEMDTGVKLTVKSSPDGNYVLTPLQIGRYAVSAQATGFQTERHENIVLYVQQNLRLDFQLHVGSVAQTAEVSSQTPLLETETASMGDVVAS